MQEEVTQKTMALAITTSRMTASVLAKAMRKFLEAQKNKSHQLPKGKQTLKELMKHNTGVSNLEITNANIRAFSATAKKYGIDFALKKDSSTQPIVFPGGFLLPADSTDRQRGTSAVRFPSGE